MAVPRARLGGPFGGPSLRTRNELDVAPLLDSVGRFATTSIQNAYLRKRQQKQDEQVAREKAEAAALAEQQRQERIQMADRDYGLRLRTFESGEQARRDQLQLERDKLAQPKPPVGRVTDPVTGEVFNIDTQGQASPVTTPDGKPFRLRVAPKTPTKSAQATPRPATEAQRKAGAFLLMAEDANKVLDAMEKTGKKVPSLGEKVGAAIGRDVGNYLTSDEYRRMQSAGLALSDAWLRYTSGAAVPEQEVARFAKSFLPLPGDDPQVLADKKQRRQNIVTALRQGVGKAGDVDSQAEDMLETIIRTYQLERKE